MKTPLLLISTYNGSKARGDHDAIRQTYLGEWGHMLHYRFFYDADATELLEDEISVPSPTGFMNGAFKTQLAVRWALSTQAEYVFIVPTDCYVIVPRLLKTSGYQDADYLGYQVPDEGHIGGGSGYWLSRRAMEAVAAGTPVVDYEDRWVGNMVRAVGLTPIHDRRYWSIEQPPPKGIITAHLSTATGVYEPSTMLAQHKAYLTYGQ